MNDSIPHSKSHGFENITSVIMSMCYAKFKNKALYPEKIKDISFTSTTRDV